MTRRHWWQHNNNNEETTMGSDWAGHTKPVRAVPKIETAAHDDFVAAERERATKMVSADRQSLKESIAIFGERFRVLPELGGDTGSETQLAELRELDALWSVVSVRAAIIRSRSEHRVGLFQQTTGKPLMPYDGGMWCACGCNRHTPCTCAEPCAEQCHRVGE